MAKLTLILACFLGSFAVGYGQGNEGTAGNRFMVMFHRQYRGSLLGTNDVIITTSEETEVTIDAPFANYSRTVTVNASQAYTIKFAGLMRTDNNMIERKGVRLTAAPGKRFMVTGANIGVSSESYLALPMTDPDVREEYVVGAYRGLSSTYSQVGVVAYMNNTNVTIVRRNQERIGYDWPNAINVMLNEFDTYMQGVLGGDMTGAMVLADKPISVFSGASCAFVPVTTQYCDHLVEQMPPISTWGKEFITSPIATRLRGDVFRIVCSADNTTVYNPRFGTRGPRVDKGGYLELNIGSRSTLYFKSTNPCLLIQYNKGISADSVRSGTDPFMMIQIPVKQYMPRHIFSVIKNRANSDFNNYLNIIAKTEASTGVTLNGFALTDWTPIRYTNFSYTQVPSLVYNTYTVQHWSPDVWLSANIYGHFGVEGYGHPTGMGMRKGDVEHPAVPITTPAPTGVTPGDFEAVCRCSIRIEPNTTAGESFPGEILVELEPVYYNNTKGECEGCHEVLRTCPEICDMRAREYWGWEGLNSLVPVNGTVGVRLRPLGQVLCQIHNGDLLPPGQRVLAYYDPGMCGPPMHTIASSTSLCCKEIDVPEIGYVIVWDRHCDGDVEFPGHPFTSTPATRSP